MLNFSAIYAPQNLAKLKTGMADVLAAFLKNGVTEQELSEAKSGLLQQWTVDRAQDAELASQLAFNLKFGRTMAFTEDREARIKSATVKQVNLRDPQVSRPRSSGPDVCGRFAKAQSAAQ